MNRTDTINAIIAAASEQRKQYAGIVVERRERIYSNGKSYSPWGVPTGVTPTEDYAAPFYVLQAKDGTTYGTRHATRDSLMAEMEAKNAACNAEFRAALEPMTTAELANQARYWLKTAHATAAA